jgi:hypothetical protein
MSWDSSVDEMSGYVLDDHGSISGWDLIFLLDSNFRLAVIHIQRISNTFPGTEQGSHSSAEVKNMWSFTSKIPSSRHCD